jgi:hypothetical protein
MKSFITDNSQFSSKPPQPRPVPPSVPIMEPPGLLLYFGLLLIAFVLIWLAFAVWEPDWPGLLINLASGIIGAVIILIFVDKRLRESEVVLLRKYAENTSVHIISIFSEDKRNAIQYAKVIQRQLDVIKPYEYISIPAVEAIPVQNPDGFFSCWNEWCG